MYVDASAIVAIIKNEPERAAFLEKLTKADVRITSIVSVFEAAMALREMTGSVAAAGRELERFFRLTRIEVRDIGADILAELAIARDRYGKGVGNPAVLNMGDCFSYAIAKHQGMRILYKGDDFSRTDLA